MNATMKAKVTLALQYGTETGNQFSSSTQWFVYNPEVREVKKRELQIGVASKTPGFGVELLRGSYSRSASLSDRDAKMGGEITRATFQVQEGLFLKCYHKRRGLGQFPQACSFLFQVLEGGALTKILVPTGQAPQSNVHVLESLGRLHRISLEEALSMGYYTPTTYRASFDPDCLEDSGVVFEEIQPSRVVVPEPLEILTYVNTETGEKETRAVYGPRRRIVLPK